MNIQSDTPRRLRLGPLKPEPAQIQLVDKDIDHPGRMILAHPVLKMLRKQRALGPKLPSR